MAFTFIPSCLHIDISTGDKTCLTAILSAARMCRYSFDMPAEADAIEAAVQKALDAGFRTGDMMAEGCQLVSCSEMGDAILSFL